MTGQIPEASQPEELSAAPGWASWARIIVLGVLCSAAGALWARQAQIIHRTCHVAESVPPLSAVAALLFLLALKPVLRALGRRAGLSQNEILCAYAFVCVAVTIGFIGMFRQILGLLATFQYAPDTDSTVRAMRPHLLPWLAPTDSETIRMLWESSEGAGVPWGKWLVPLASLGGILLLFYLTCTFMMGLFYRRWSREERLRFPVAEIALELAGDDQERGLGKLARNQWFWVGCIMALLFNLAYIIPAIFEWRIPSVQFDFNSLQPPHPWNAGAPGPYFRLNPIIFGLGFLVSMDVLLTIWLSVVVIKLEAVVLAHFGVRAGYGGPLFLMSRQQGVGGYLALALIMAWVARRHIAAAVKDIVKPGRLASGAPGRGTLLGFVIGVGLLFALFDRAGMVWWLAGVFLVLLLVRVLVMARVRAQAGIPNIYLHVFEARTMLWLLGGATLALAGEKSIAAMILLSFLIRCTLVTPHIADGFRISEVTGFGYWRWIVLTGAAVATGFVLATITQLTAIYDHGFLSLGQHLATWPANQIVSGAALQTPLEPTRLAVAGTGFLTTVILAVCQRTLYWFPFSPVGFVVACAIGDYICGPIFFAWFLKRATLKYGGGPAFRAARTMCIGLVFAHLAIAALWGLLGAFDLPPTRRYAIGFW